ncbi:MAG: Dynamin family protein, partial [Desulfobacterales bacterium]
DLVLVLFDPHKAGTVRETHTSLRDTLPAKTFEDRVLFVLNRIDECASLIDLLQVYGTLCWNLSQMTGRKDIPPIRLTYSPHVMQKAAGELNTDQRYLRYLDNQRMEVKEAVLQAPRFRLDNLATFVETHGERLSHMLEALVSYCKRKRRFFWRHLLISLTLSVILGGGAVVGAITAGLIGPDPYLMAAVGGGSAVLLFVLWLTTGMRWLRSRFHRDQMRHLDRLTPLRNQTRRDSWQSIRDLVYLTLKRTAGKIARKEVKSEYEAVHRIYTEGSKDIREALNELATLEAGEAPAWSRAEPSASPRDFPYQELARQD